MEDTTAQSQKGFAHSHKKKLPVTNLSLSGLTWTESLHRYSQSHDFSPYSSDTCEDSNAVPLPAAQLLLYTTDVAKMDSINTEICILNTAHKMKLAIK